MSKHVNSNKSFVIIVFIYLLALFLFPEMTKVISIMMLIATAFLLFAYTKKISINHQFLAWFTYIILTLLSVLRDFSNLNNVIEFGGALVIGLLIYSWNSKGSSQILQIKALVAVSFVAFLGCIVQLVAPEFLAWFNLLHLGLEKFQICDGFLKDRTLVGFSFQSAITGFYLSVFIGILSCYLLKPSIEMRAVNKKIIFLLLVICYVFLMQTGKRSFVLLVILIDLFMYCLYNRKYMLKALFVSIVVCVLFLVILLKTDVGMRLVMRTVGDSWSSGRINIYGVLWDEFMQNPIIGKGIATSSNIWGRYNNGHNIYLQILSESGLIGIFVLMPVFIHDLGSSMKLLNAKIRYGDDSFVVAVCLFLELLFLGWGFSGNPLYDVYPLVIYMLVAGIIRNEIKKSKYISQIKTL